MVLSPSCSPSLSGISAPLFYAVLLASVLGFGVLADHMSAPLGARSVDAVELALEEYEEREQRVSLAARSYPDPRLQRRPS